MIIKVLYCSRYSDDNMVTFDTESKTYTYNDVSGWDVFVEAKMSKDVTDIKKQLVRMGYTKKGDLSGSRR